MLYRFAESSSLQEIIRTVRQSCALQNFQANMIIGQCRAGAAKGAARQAQQATPDLSGVFDDLAGKVKNTKMATALLAK